jgi:hypothetical protein
MYKRIFVFLALALALFVTPSWAQSCGVEESNCHTFSSASTTFTYTFSDGSRLTVQFVTVLTMFDLRVGESHPTDSTCVGEGCGTPISLDPNEFPSGTVCVGYPTNFQGQCDQYDFTGNAGGPHGVPVRNTDYKGLIELTLSYNTFQTVHQPAFGHAPGDITTFTEDILTGYSQPASDPTMDGSTPGLSSVVPLDEPLQENDTFCFVSPAPFSTFSASTTKVIEVSFQLFSSGTCPGTGTPIRDKTARLSLSMRDTNGNVVFPPIVDKEEGNKFHWDNKAGLNEFDLSTEGLAPGNYTITVRSSKASPHSISFTLTP